MTINTDHLIGIFTVIEREVPSSVEALSLLSSDSKEDLSDRYSTLPDLLDQTGKKIRSQFFATRKDVPRNEELLETRQFDTVSVFSVRLALVLEACKHLSSADAQNIEQLTIKCKKQLQRIIEQAGKALSSCDSNAQLFLIRKLMLIHDLPQIKSDESLIATIRPQLTLMIRQLCQSVVPAQPNSKTQTLFADIARFLNQYASVLNQDELFRTFIEGTKACFICQQTGNYRQRLDVINAIHASWGLLRNRLSSDDLNWLQEISVNINCQYGKLPARYMKPINILRDCCQYFREWGGYIVGIGFFTGGIAYLSSKASQLLLANMNAAVRAVDKLRNALLDPALDETGRQLLTSMIEMQEKMFLRGRTSEEFLAQNEQLEKQLNWYPYFVAAVGTAAASYGIFQFARSPSEPRPVPLPAWVDIRRNELAREAKESDSKAVAVMAPA